MLPNASDVVVGHTSWSSYAAMYPRTFKHLHLPAVIAPANDPAGFAAEMRHVHYSASPGLMASLDDLYLVQTHDLGFLSFKRAHHTTASSRFLSEEVL